MIRRLVPRESHRTRCTGRAGLRSRPSGGAYPWGWTAATDLTILRNSSVCTGSSRCVSSGSAPTRSLRCRRSCLRRRRGDHRRRVRCSKDADRTVRRDRRRSSDRRRLRLRRICSGRLRSRRASCRRRGGVRHPSRLDGSHRGELAGAPCGNLRSRIRSHGSVPRTLCPRDLGRPVGLGDRVAAAGQTRLAIAMVRPDAACATSTSPGTPAAPSRPIGSTVA